MTKCPQCDGRGKYFKAVEVKWLDCPCCAYAEQRYQEALDAVLLTLASNTCATVEGPGVDWAIQIINSKLRQHSQEGEE